MASTQIYYENKTNQKVDVFWENFEGGETLYKTLKPEYGYDQQTYVGHKWVIRFKGGMKNGSEVMRAIGKKEHQMIQIKESDQ